MKYFRYSIVIVLALLFSFTAHAGPNVTVDFETDPLFSEADIAPGDSTTKWVRVTNHTVETQVIGVMATNTYDCGGDPYCLADVLDIEIKEGATTLYTNTLAGFFSDGGVVLSNLAGSDTQTQYDVTVSFPVPIENEYQNLATQFDLIFGFVQDAGGEGGGIEIVISTVSSGGGSSGGGGSVGGGGFFEPLIHLQKSGDISVTLGGIASYTIVITNLGSASASNLLIIDSLPPGFTFTGPTTGTIYSNGYEQAWTLPILGPKAIHTITYTLLAPPDASGQYTNRASVSADGKTVVPYFADDAFDFSVVTVAGFQYDAPGTVSESANGTAGGSNTQQPGSSSGQDDPSVLGFEYLPVTGGDILAYFGVGDSSVVLQPEKRTQISHFLIGAVVYSLALITILFLRFRRKNLVKKA